MAKTKYQILDLLQKHTIPYARKGKSYVARCPFCKGDTNLRNHNAEINPDTGTIYCFSEQKTYFIKDLLVLFGEISEKDLEKLKEKIKSTAHDNTSLMRAAAKRRKFDDVKNSLVNQGYSITGIYRYCDLNGVKQYDVVRFEKPSMDGRKPEKIPIPVDIDGFVGLSQGKRQIPYRLEQFLAIESDQIWLCEGEKCCDAVIAAMPDSASIICLGFRKASDFKGFENLFKNKKVVLFEDNDRTGITNTEKLVELCKPIAKEITIVKFSEFEEGYDVADFLQDFSWNQLLDRIEISDTIATPVSQTDIIKKGTEVEIQKQEEWILEPFIPTNSIILLDGLGGTGKSIFAMEMAYAISTGQSFLLQDLTPTGNYPILYLTAEETDWRFFERLQKIENAYCIKSENFFWVSTLSKDFCLATTRLFHKRQNEVQPAETFVFLENAIKKTQAKLIVIDSWTNFYGLDENSTEDGSAAYDFIKSLIRQYGCSILIIHHQTKEAMRGNANIFRGTMVFREQARARIVITRRDEQKIVAIEKLNYPSELISKFPVAIEIHHGAWTAVYKRGENGKPANTSGDEKWLQKTDYF
jgi:KaiC/GvpD/RAD55 family RecA-like ATPase